MFKGVLNNTLKTEHMARYIPACVYTMPYLALYTTALYIYTKTVREGLKSIRATYLHTVYSQSSWKNTGIWVTLGHCGLAHHLHFTQQQMF